MIRDGLCLDRPADAVPDDEGSLSPPYRRGRGGDVPGGRKRAFRRAQERADQDLREGEAEGKGEGRRGRAVERRSAGLGGYGATPPRPRRGGETYGIGSTAGRERVV